MSSSKIERDSVIYNAWRLFVANGQIKSDVIGSALAVKWERYRLLGLRANDKLLTLPQSEGRTFRTFFADLIEHSEFNSKALAYSAVIVDDERIIQDTYIVDSNLAVLAAGAILNESQTGNLSLYQSIANKKTNAIFGAEHYLKHFHSYTDLTIPFQINDKYYYFILFIPLRDYSDQLLERASDILKRWQMIWKLKGQNDKVDLTECARITINHKGVVLQSNDALNFNLDDVVFTRLVDFSIELLLTEGAICTEDRIAQQPVVVVLLKQNQTRFELAIRRVNIAFDHYKNIDLFNSLLETSVQFKPIDQRVTEFASQFKPILLIGNQYKALSDGVKAFLNSGLYGDNYFTVDATLYNFRADTTALKWYRELSNCCIVLKHIECLDLKQQNDLLQVMCDNAVSLRNNNVHILIAALLPNDRDHFISEQIKEYCQNTTAKCFKTEQTRTHYTYTSYQNRKLESLSEIEANAIKNTLIATGGNISKSAKILKIGRTTLHRKIKQYQIETK